MNLLARAKMSSHLIFFSPSPGKRLFNLHPSTALQQCDFYSTKTAHSSQKTQQLTKPKTQKSSGSSSSFSQRIKKQTEALTTVWPKPRDIPYQAKVANFVNLIGYVELPVRFEADSDGKHFATTVISLGNGGERNSLTIPVVFEGDLAHVVSCHVKENDCVFVSGQLSVDPMKLVLSESLGKFHVVAENVNFVEGFERNVVDKRIGVAFSAVEIDKPGKHAAKVFDEMPVEIDKPGKHAAKVFDEMPERAGNDDKLLLKADTESVPPAASFELGINEKNGESVSKKKDGNQILDLWRDLVKNPLQWWDYRNHKANGLVKEKFPDFKQKMTGESLWVNSAPNWVLPGLAKLEFDVKDVKPYVKDIKPYVKDIKPREIQGGEGPRVPGESKRDGTNDETWKNLVENPDKWWDNRTNKRNPKAPDFKHKETGEVLWLNRSPVWALSKLPPMKDGQNTTDGKYMRTF
ncbi:hypothetical protein DH2020_025996 [Rehmannia glutinosa]|uniref:Uncharacterized protein n=1 Tax=Rehmannia glutinosa TaxID=99300 RepID=A0ABR0VXZ7_REHGL